MLAAAPLRADAPPPPQVPVSATSQCVEGPGAPPSDPTKVTRVVPGAKPGARPAAPEEPPIDAAPPGAPAPVLLELGASLGGSVRLDNGTWGVTTSRAGLVLGGSLFVWPNRTLALGAAYTHADLNRSSSAPGSADTFNASYDVHALMLEARAAPFRFAYGSVFAIVGVGPAWQSVSARGASAPVDTKPRESKQCKVGSNADLSFRAGLGLKARLTRAASLLADLTFTGYRLSGDILDDCAIGAGTAQTIMLRAGFSYDVDISRVVR